MKDHAAPHRPFPRLCLPGILAVLLAGCDSFSLPDQFILPGEDKVVLALAVDNAVVQRNGSVGLLPSGGEKPYRFDAPSAFDLSTGTATYGVGYITNATYTAGGAIGKVRITLRDAGDATAFAYVTILPPKPTLLGERIGGNQTINLTWTFPAPDAEILTGFLLECSTDGSAFTASGTHGKDSVGTSFNNLNASAGYTYRLRALSGTYESEPVTISL
ncbi:MAG: fibronectin type III domain-containing protein [Spirochaetaceae bacterium]|nr:fibronectin type III domain-containing protein [Spirochaetaceae bacterium]